MKNNIIIGAVLVAVIVIAVGFVVAPIHRATTIHPVTVGAGAIADGAVTNVKLAADAVTTDKILDGTITGADIGAGGIDASGDFAGGVVNDAAIADGITVSKLGDAAGITDILFGTATLAAVLIAAGAVQVVAVAVATADVTNDVVLCDIDETATNDALVIHSAEITGAGAVTVEVLNTSAAGVTPAGTEDITCIVFKRP